MITKNDIREFNRHYRTLLRGDDFIYLLPHPGLQGVVSNYTIVFPGQDMIPDSYTIIPHGCATLVFSCDGSGFGSSLFGPMVRPCAVGKPAGLCTMLLIIEFHPAGLYRFIGADQKELTDTVFSFDEVQSVLNGKIQGIFEHAGSLAGLIDSLDLLLLSGLQYACPSTLQTALGLIVVHAGCVTQKEVAEHIFYSERHLNRLFNRCLGMSVKTFSRMVRINKAVRLMQNPQSSITSIAGTAGFHDLPHFIHDFKTLCGITPQEFRNNMSDFYSEIAKF